MGALVALGEADLEKGALVALGDLDRVMLVDLDRVGETVPDRVMLVDLDSVGETVLLKVVRLNPVEKRRRRTEKHCSRVLQDLACRVRRYEADHVLSPRAGRWAGWDRGIRSYLCSLASCLTYTHAHSMQ